MHQKLTPSQFSISVALLLAHAWRVMLETILRAFTCFTTLYVVDIHPRSPSQFQTCPYDPSISRTILNAIRLTYCQCTLYGIALFLHDALPRNDSVKVRRSQRLFLSLGNWASSVIFAYTAASYSGRTYTSYTHEERGTYNKTANNPMKV